MKVKLPNRHKVIRPMPCGQAGMTLVEVIMALAVATVLMAGVVSGYIYCLTWTQKAEFVQVASAKAMERLEQAKSAQWDVSYPYVDQLVATNFPDEIVSLNVLAAVSGGTPATVVTTISQISVTPPLRMIHVDCIWQNNGDEFVTNSIETIRAPDQ